LDEGNLGVGQNRAVRIAIVSPYAWTMPGGVQSHIRALAPALRARDHDVLVIAPRSARDGPFDEGEAMLVGRAVGIPANGSVAPIAFGPAAAAGVRRALRDFDPDVVHLHEPLIPSLSLLALWVHSGPTVGTFHAAAESSFGYRAIAPALRPAAARLTVRTAVSDAARSLVARHFPGDYRLTPNGIDAARYATAQPMDLGPGKTVLFFGRIERRKGLETLIQAMTRLRDLDVTLVVAGDGPQARRCRQLAEHLQIKTLWLGRVHDDHKPSIYKAADVYCAPGVGGESFGIVLIEAMAAGAPVVCSDLEGFRSVATGAAELFPSGNAGRLADSLRAVLTNDDKARSMQKAGYRTAGMYDWKRLVAGIEAIYDRARFGGQND
jgi:phosphatidyl-myo-inositol alpha-mannosyltransferase